MKHHLCFGKAEILESSPGNVSGYFSTIDIALATDDYRISLIAPNANRDELIEKQSICFIVSGNRMEGKIVG